MSDFDLIVAEGAANGFEFAVSSRLRHGALWRLVKRFGTQASLARHLGITLRNLNRLVNMKGKPPTGAEWWSRVMGELLLLTGQTEAELFPQWSQEFLDAAKSSEQFKRLDTKALLNIQDNRDRPLIDAVVSAEESAIVLANLKLLSQREQKIVKLRFGIDCECMTYGEIGSVIGVTKERVRQIEGRALIRLRKTWRS